MADHPDITPAELAKALEVFLATGSYSAAARAIGRTRVGTMQALRRASNDNTRQQVYARTLEAACDRATRDVARTAQELRRDAANAKPSARASIAFALNDSTRTLVTARTAHAKLTGDHAAEKVEARVDVVDDLRRRIARLAPDDAAGGDPREPHDR